jgi:hypothetical protein
MMTASNAAPDATSPRDLPPASAALTLVDYATPQRPDFPHGAARPTRQGVFRSSGIRLIAENALKY